MPVVVLYKEKGIPVSVADKISLGLAKITSELLEAKIEVRIIEPISAYNANPIHVEMRFRDFSEWDDKKLGNYHNAVMKSIGTVLKDQNIQAQYSSYIIPSMPPRSIWA